MKYTTVLWDLDGTIVDSGPGIFATFRQTFDAIGHPQLPESQLRTYVGPPLRETFSKHLGFSPERTDEALAAYRDFYHAGGATNALLYEGVVDVIAACKEAGITNSLATSKALRGAMVVGEHFDFLKHFDFFGTADFDANRFTKSSVIAYALDGLAKQGANLDRVILIGDRIHDIEGAREHGIEVALVQWGYGNPDEWALADYALGDVASLARLLGVFTT